MIGPFGRQGPTATLRQLHPEMTRRRCDPNNLHAVSFYQNTLLACLSGNISGIKLLQPLQRLQRSRTRGLRCQIGSQLHRRQLSQDRPWRDGDRLPRQPGSRRVLHNLNLCKTCDQGGNSNRSICLWFSSGLDVILAMTT